MIDNEWSILIFIITLKSSFPVTSKSESSSNKQNKYAKEYDKPGKQLLILYATEYGFSQELAQLLFDR